MRVLVLALLLFSFQPLHAQKEWTLEECIQYAFENNLTIKQAQYALDVAGQNSTQYQWAQYPTLNFNTSYNINSGRVIDPFTNVFTNESIQSMNLNLGGSWLLFNGFQTRYTRQQYKSEEVAALYDLERTKNDVALNVTNQYMQLLFLEEQVVTQRNQLEITRQQKVRTERLVTAGVIAEASYLDIQAQEANEELAIIETENTIQLTYLNMANLLNLEDISQFRVMKPGEVIVPDSMMVQQAHEVFLTSLENQPNIKAAEQRKESAALNLSASKGRLYPRLSLNYSLSSLYSSSSKIVTGYTLNGVRTIGYTELGDSVYTPNISALTSKKPMADQFKDNFNKFIGLSLTIPIVNGMQNRTAMHRAFINTRIAENNYNLEKNQLRYNVYNAYTSVIGSQKKYTASQKALRAQQEAFRSAEKRYEQGIINSLEYSQAKNRLAQNESTMLRAKYEYLFRVKIMDFYMGKPIR